MAGSEREPAAPPRRQVTTGGRLARIPESMFRPLLGVCVLVGAAVRVGVYLAVHRGTPLDFNDAGYYTDHASRLADGIWFTDPSTGMPVAEHAPLTTLLLAPVSWVAAPLEWQRMVTMATGLATVAVLGLVGRRIGGCTVGVAAAGLAALYPNLWLNDGVVMSESVAALCIAFWMLAGCIWDERRSTRWAFVFGLAAGAAALARSELVVLVVVTVAMVLFLERGRRGRVLAAVMGAALVLAPWVAPNLVRFEQPVVLSTNGGTTLRGANCDATYSGRALGGWHLPCLVIEPATGDLEPSRRSDRWRTEGLTYAREHADRLPVVVLARVGRALDVIALDHQVDEDVRDGRPRWGSWAGVVSFWVMVPLAVVGFARTRGAPRRLLIAPVLIVAVTTVVFYGGHRIRAPLEPSLVLAGAVGVVAAVRRAAGGAAVPAARAAPPGLSRSADAGDAVLRTGVDAAGRS